MRSIRYFSCLTAILLAGLSICESTGFGVNGHIPSEPVADRIDSAGIEWVRIDFLWSLVEPDRDAYDWSVYDNLVARLESRGLRIFAGLGATPQWATQGSEFSGVPEDVDDWREFCYLASHRYAGRIHAWGLWNEPNLDRFWEGSRQEYIDEILLPGAGAIALGDPAALIAAPDLAHLSSADWDSWLRDTINAAGDLLDVVTHHVYPSDGWAWEVTYDLETGGPFPFSPPSVLEVLQDNGWGGRPFWLTETGVESDRWGETRQANFVNDLLTEWFSPTRGHRDWVDRLFFYEMNDAPTPSEYTYGLIEGPPEFAPKEAYLAYAGYIGDAVVDDAEVIHVNIPRYFRTGETVKASVSLRNSGTTDWAHVEATRLVAEIDSFGWQIEAGQLMEDEVVPPGEIRKFELALTPPSAPMKAIGEHPFLSIRLEREGSWLFGDMVREEVILVALPPPRISQQPTSRRVNPGAETTLLIEAYGAQPLSYQWLRNGTIVSDDDLFSDSNSPRLTIHALSREIAAFYQCVVSNSVGAVVSDTVSVVIGQTAPRSGSGRVVPNDQPADAGSQIRVRRLSGPPERP